MHTAEVLPCPVSTATLIGQRIASGNSIYNSLQFGLVKRLTKGLQQFRAEIINILNRANFTTPGIGGRIAGGNNGAIVFAGSQDGEAPLATAGRINSTSSTSRQIQFALKLLF